MTSRILGKKIVNTYYVDNSKDKYGNFKARPFMTYDTEIISWEDIIPEINEDINLSYDVDSIKISESEEVDIEYRKYRADINTWMYYTDKIVDEIHINEKEAESELITLRAEYNKSIVENDEKMKAYCNLNNLNPETVNVDDLRKILGIESISKYKDLPSWLYPQFYSGYYNNNGNRIY